MSPPASVQSGWVCWYLQTCRFLTRSSSSERCSLWEYPAAYWIFPPADHSQVIINTLKCIITFRNVTQPSAADLPDYSCYVFLQPHRNHHYNAELWTPSLSVSLSHPQPLTCSFRSLLLYMLLISFFTSGHATSTLVRMATWGIPAGFSD